MIYGPPDPNRYAWELEREYPDHTPEELRRYQFYRDRGYAYYEAMSVVFHEEPEAHDAQAHDAAE